MLLVGYPVLPWFGIMLAGFACGMMFKEKREDRQRLFLQVSVALLALFISVRLINLWGDPSAWSLQKDWVFTFMSFINVSKYPPSLLYTLVTIGIAFLLLFVAERVEEASWKDILMVYGNVPMFYYLITFI